MMMAQVNRPSSQEGLVVREEQQGSGAHGLRSIKSRHWSRGPRGGRHDGARGRAGGFARGGDVEEVAEDARDGGLVEDVKEEALEEKGLEREVVRVEVA